MNDREETQKGHRARGSRWSDIGHIWTKVGVHMGKLALETSAETMKTISSLLDRVSGEDRPKRHGKRTSRAGSESATDSNSGEQR